MSFPDHVLSAPTESELAPFRARTLWVVSEDSPSSLEFTGLRNAEVLVSRHRLEKYLNPCNPSCSG